MANLVSSRRYVTDVARTIAVGLLALVAVAGLGSTAAAQDESTTTEVTTEGPSSAGNILPRPDSGQAPDSANDPGGWQQYMVFALIGLGLLAIVVLATRDSRRIRRAQGRYP